MPTERLTVKKLPASRTLCTLIPTPEEQTKAEEAALKRLAEQVSVKGFRPGHAPLDVVKEKVGEQGLFEETIREILRRELQTIAEEHKLQPVIPPKVEAVSKDPLTLSITFIERPEVTLKNADKLTIEKKELKADEKDVQNVLNSVLQEYKTTQSVDRPAKEGDDVTANFRATDEQGNEITGLRADNYRFSLGGKTLLPGFEDEVVGMKKGEKKTFTLTLPEKFAAEELRGKKATFELELTDIQEVYIPELTDELAKEKLNAPSAAEFRKTVEQSILGQEEQFERMRRERELMEEIKKQTKVELADELLQEETNAILNEWQQQLKERGMTPEDALKQQQKTPEQFMEEMKKQAEERWKLRLGMSKLIEERGIAVSDEEIQGAFDEFIATVPEDQRGGAAQEWEKRGQLYEELRWRALVGKTVDSVLAA